MSKKTHNEQLEMTPARHYKACVDCRPDGYNLLWFKDKPNKGFMLSGMAFYQSKGEDKSLLCRVMEVDVSPTGEYIGATVIQNIVTGGVGEVKYVEDIQKLSLECLKNFRSIAPSYPLDKVVGSERFKFAEKLAQQGIDIKGQVEARNFMFKVADALNLSLTSELQPIAFGGFANFVSFADIQEAGGN